MASTSIDKLIAAIEEGRTAPVYVVSGELVIAEPQAARLAAALASKVGCEVERHRRPPSLDDIIADLRTYSLFASGKVILAVDTAILADRSAAAALIDQAEEGLPVADPAAELSAKQRGAASRLVQACRLFGTDPYAGAPEAALKALPNWVFEGDKTSGKRSRIRTAKQRKTLQAGLTDLLAAARQAGLQGIAEGSMAKLGEIVESGLPPGHGLVLAEQSLAKDHPLVKALGAAGTVVALGRVEAGKGGDWQGLAPVVAELSKETGVGMAGDAVAELARRTLRQRGGWNDRTVEAASTARFAAEYRKLAAEAGDGTITRALVAASVRDRGEEDVWQILNALGEGRAGEAVGRFRRMVASADDVMSARLSFFGLLAGFCRQLVAVAGMMQITEVPAGERSYNRFKMRYAPRLQGALSATEKSPLAGLHPFRLYRAYLAASRLPSRLLLRLPWLVLETEMRIKGESSDPDGAIALLMITVAMARVS